MKPLCFIKDNLAKSNFTFTFSYVLGSSEDAFFDLYTSQEKIASDLFQIEYKPIVFCFTLCF